MSVAAVAVELTLAWHGFVFDVVVLPERRRKAFTLGETRRDYPIPQEWLGADRYRLVTFDRGVPRVAVPADPRSTDPGTPTADPQTYQELGVDQTVEVRLGPLTASVSRLPRRRYDGPRAFSVDWRAGALAAASAAVCLVLLAWTGFCVPPLETDVEFPGRPLRTLHVQALAQAEAAAVAERPPPPRAPRTVWGEGRGKRGLQTSVRRPVDPQAGDREAAPVRSRVALRGPPDNPDVRLTWRRGPDGPALWGWWFSPGAVGDPNAPLIDSSRDWSAGVDPLSARSPRTDGPIGSSRAASEGAPLAAEGRLRKVVTFVGARAL
ncbi:MAG: hypothetical protein JW940_03225 [Polyangiaceae bacterium]|nr:hypothetical protein [Polyangiaceae bacterium]